MGLNSFKGLNGRDRVPDRIEENIEKRVGPIIEYNTTNKKHVYPPSEYELPVSIFGANDKETHNNCQEYAEFIFKYLRIIFGANDNKEKQRLSKELLKIIKKYDEEIEQYRKELTVRKQTCVNLEDLIDIEEDLAVIVSMGNCKSAVIDTFLKYSDEHGNYLPLDNSDSAKHL